MIIFFLALFFGVDREVWFLLYSFPCKYSVIQAPFVEKTNLFSVEWSEHLDQNQLSVNIKTYSDTLNSIPTIYVHMPMPYSLDNCSFVTSSEIRKCSVLIF